MPDNPSIAPKRLIVCDDDGAFAHEVLTLATSSGLDARIATCASDFLDIFGGFNPDVVMMDLRLPGIDGVGLVRRAVRHGQTPRIIFASAMGAPALRAARSIAEASGFADVFELEKPIDPRRLSALLAVPMPGEREPSAGEVARALAAGDFELHYQPILNLHTGEIDGAEGLARWRHANEGVLSPDRFLKQISEIGRLHTLTTAMIEDGLSRLASWRRDGFDVVLSLNVPVTSFLQVDFVDWLLARLSRTCLPSSAITLEITESQARPELSSLTDALLRLRVAGVGVALDDFGTGFASLRDLWQMPLTQAKVDRYFLANCRRDPRGKSFLRSIVGLCHDVGLAVCGEGVESAEDLGTLRAAGCDRAQGFLVSRALPPPAFTTFLKSPQEMAAVPGLTARRLT